MADSDGQVKIIFETNAKEVLKDMNSVNKAFSKNADTMKNATSATSAYEQVVQDNIKLLREAALGGNQNTEAFKKLAAQTKEYKQALENANAQVEKAIGSNDRQNNAMEGLAGAAKKLAGAYIGLQSIRAVINYSAQAVEAFRTQERAVLQLDQTLQNAGVYTNEYSQHIQKLASEIQSYSNYGDEAIIKAQALAQAYIGNTKITDGLTKATIDFAAATGMDLESAFTLVGKSIGSQTNALGRYGISLEKGMTDSQKMEAIQRQLGQRYEGTATQVANASTQLSNAFGDLKEAVGRVLNPAVESAQKALTSLIVSITNALSKMSDAVDAINGRTVQSQLDKASGMLAEAEKYRALAAKEEARAAALMGKRPTSGILARAESYKKQALEFEAAANRAKNKAEEFQKQLDKNNNNNPTKITDDFGLGGSSTSTGSAKVIKDDYEKLQAAVQSARREIELAAVAHGTSSVEVQNAFVKYNQLNSQLSSINNLFNTEKQKVDETKGAYAQLQERISNLKTELLNLGAEGGIGTSQFEQLKNEYIAAMDEIRNIDKGLTDTMGKDWDNVSKSISSALGSTLTSALQGGQNALQTFSSIATSLLQQVLNKMIEMAIIKPIIDSFTGGTGGTIFSAFGGLFSKHANGDVFQNGNVIPFAKGGVVSKPTIFPMANGGTGLMGEAGAEAVMPLRRMSNGRLGVEASNDGNGKAVQVNIYNQSNSQVETRQRDDGSMDIIIKRVNEALMNERTSSGFRTAYQREDRKGLQAV